MVFLALLVAAVWLTGAPAASAATPQEICAALQAQGIGALSQFSPADVQAFLTDPTIQGYGCPGVILPPPTPTAPAPAPCVETTPSSPAPAPAPAPPSGSGGEQCTTPAPAPVPVATPVVTASAPAPVVAAVAGARKTIVAKAKPKATVAAAKSPTKAAVAPVSTTRKHGTLPFTGAELGLFALVGLGLIAGGILLRTTGRQRSQG
jgi:hypothetical protein